MAATMIAVARAVMRCTSISALLRLRLDAVCVLYRLYIACECAFVAMPGRVSPMMLAVDKPFQVEESTIADLHAAYLAGRATVRSIVQGFLDRIVAYDRKGPVLGAVISVNARALDE